VALINDYALLRWSYFVKNETEERLSSSLVLEQFINQKYFYMGAVVLQD